jgi:two-component system cell cycle response regulator
MNVIDLDIDNQLEPHFSQGNIKKILLIEDSTVDANAIETMLTEAIDSQFNLIRTDRLDNGLEQLLGGGFDIVLLDLSLPDSQGLDTFSKLYEQVSNVPIIVLAIPEEETFAVKATQLGAKDYIIKGKIDATRLGCAVQYAIDQHSIEDELGRFNLIDEPSGLYSRNAFLVLGHHYLKLANRIQRGLILLYVQVNATSLLDGEEKNVLIDFANILKQTFRRSDIIARIKSKEFAVIALEAHKESAKILGDRFQKNLRVYGGKDCSTLAVKITSAYYNPQQQCSIAELMARARKSLCNKK